MAVPSPADADAATVRVRLVADMLLQKAQEVQSKGNAGAAQSLSESAADLQRAAALLHELARLVHMPPPRLRSDSDASLSSVASNDGSTVSSMSFSSSAAATPSRAPPPASTSVKDLVAKLSRVDAMLGKKSDEMKHKGNEGAAHALQQSALAVRLAAQHIAEQQLLTRTLVVSARALREQLREHCRVVLADEDEISDETPLDEELTKRALENLRALAAMRDVLREVAPTAATSPDDLRDLLLRGAQGTDGDQAQEVERLSDECASLQRQLEEAQARHERELRDANDESENLRCQCAALEKALAELEAEYHERRERELEHLNALHERQKGTHEELKKLLLAKEEEVTALKLQADAWMNQFAQQQDTIEELRDQLEEDHHFSDRQVIELREQLQVRDAELRTARDELRVLHQQLEDQPRGEENDSAASPNEDNSDAIIEDLRQQLESIQSHRDTLLVEREDTLVAMEEAQLLVDTIRSDFQARLDEATRSSETANELLKAGNARISELEVALVAAADQSSNASGGEQRAQELQAEAERLQLNLDEERARYVTLEQLHEQARAALESTQKELQTQVEALASLREEQAQRAAEVSTQSTLTREYEQRVSEMESELSRKSARVEALETELQEQNDTLAALKSEVDAAEQARAAAEERASATLVRLQETQSELAVAREENAALQRDLLDIVRQLNPAGDSEVGNVPVEHVTKVLGVRCTEVLNEIKEVKNRCDTMTTSHEAERAELQTTIRLLEEQKATVAKQYEELKATQLASSEANGVKESESEELTKKLETVETEFERYRTRSHAALKKIEKRAELLNSMRKENEGLTRQIEELKVALSGAEEKEHHFAARLEEAGQTLRMREEEMAQQIQDMAVKLEEAEQKVKDIEDAGRDAQQRCDEATATVAKLQEEKEELAHAKHALHAQVLEQKDAEVAEAKATLEEAQARLTQLEEQAIGLGATIAQRDEQIATLENDIRSLQDASNQAASRAVQLQRDHEATTAQMKVLAVSLEEKQHQLAALVATKDAESGAAVAAHDVEKRVTEEELASREASWAVREEELKAQLRAATHETDELTARLMEVQLAKVAADQATDQLRSEVQALKNELVAMQATASAPVSSSPPVDSIEMAALRESFHAKEAQIVRLLDEIEMVSKRQIEDQRTIAELKGQLSQSEQRVVEARDQLRLAVADSRDAAPPAATDAPMVEAAEAKAQEGTIRALRERVRQLEAAQVERSSDVQDELTDDEAAAPRKDSDDLASLQARRQSKREQHEQEMETANRKQAVTAYLRKTSDVIRELQQSMDEYSSVFRDACALREEEADADGGQLNGHTEGVADAADADASDRSIDSTTTAAEYEEYLVLKSGVVVKAGSTFSLPVYCDKPGCRVEWKFAVTEDGADVGFALLVETTASDGTLARETIVAPARVNVLSGVYDALLGAPGATAALRFEWDNTFSWLNEKTLDYHVTVLEPLSAAKQSLRVQERELRAKVAKLDGHLTLLQTERQRRAQLENALEHFAQCAEEKDAHLARFAQRRVAIQESKTALHARMEELKTQLSAFVSELDDMATGESEVTKAWDALSSEHDDVDMTMRLSANSRLDELSDTLQSRKKLLEDELAKVSSTIASSA